MTFDQKSEPFEGMNKVGSGKQGADSGKFKFGVFETSKKNRIKSRILTGDTRCKPSEVKNNNDDIQIGYQCSK